MTAIASVKQQISKEMGSRGLVADSKETWGLLLLSLTLFSVLARTRESAGGGLTQ